MHGGAMDCGHSSRVADRDISLELCRGDPQNNVTFYELSSQDWYASCLLQLCGITNGNYAWRLYA